MVLGKHVTHFAAVSMVWEIKTGGFQNLSLDSQNWIWNISAFLQFLGVFPNSMRHSCARWKTQRREKRFLKQHFNTPDLAKGNVMCLLLNHQVFREARMISRHGFTKIVWGQAWPARSQEPGDIFLAKRVREMVLSYVSSVTPSLGIQTSTQSESFMWQTQWHFPVPKQHDGKFGAPKSYGLF